jgi:Metal binding domain of Ada/Staphylococcal nuclease homologue
MLNETIVCEGYGNALTRYPFRQDYMTRFRSCERQAREQGKGLWREALTGSARAQAQPVSASAGEIKGNSNSHIYHLPTCPNYGKVSTKNAVTFTSEEEAQQAGYRSCTSSVRIIESGLLRDANRA